MEQIKPTSLIHGCDIISRRLCNCLIPIGLLYRFDPNPPHRPRPLPILVVAANCLSPLVSIVTGVMMRYFSNKVDKNSDEYKTLAASVFIARLATLVSLFRIFTGFANCIIVLAQHGSMSNVMASSNSYVTEREQARFAKTSFAFFFITVVSIVMSYMASFSLTISTDENSRLFYALAIFTLYMTFLQRLSTTAELMYTCYLGSALGKHVENFSIIYVDTMFDQFMKALEKEDTASGGFSANQVRSLPFFADSRSSSSGGSGGGEGDEATAGSATKGREDARAGWGYMRALFAGLRALGRLVIRALTYAYNLVRNTATRLNMRRYPELPEMKMTKLSSTTNIQISETMRMANNHLIRVRLRRTQIMLSELRDLVSDINKTSSPLVLIYLTLETCLIVLITTASVQAKVYKSIDLLILPTITVTLGLVTNVIYICTCYDETTKQLKLLINKLFDFIIMNHQVQSTGRRAIRAKAQIHANDSEVCIIPGSETGAINETWSQFQYTRKLANTIQFTMGGILPVTRRLVLSILGHILSAVFISIEIMSIIDTLNMPHGGNSGSGHGDAHGPSMNSSASQYNSSDFRHHHHHQHTQPHHHHIQHRDL